MVTFPERNPAERRAFNRLFYRDRVSGRMRADAIVVPMRREEVRS